MAKQVKRRAEVKASPALPATGIRDIKTPKTGGLVSQPQPTGFLQQRAPVGWHEDARPLVADQFINTFPEYRRG